jgi:hypothetical protein
MADTDNQATIPVTAGINPHQLVFSDLTTDFNDFKNQMQGWLGTQSAWKGTLTTMTSTTLIDLNSSVGTFMATRLNRAMQDAYAETALNDNAIRAIAQMQGLRMTRYLPAQVKVQLKAPFDVSIPALSQFSIGGKNFFNRKQITINAGIEGSFFLYQGYVRTIIADDADGSDLQAYIADEDGFIISDQDVQVQINNILIPKALGGLWNYRNLPAYSDLTMADGRLLIQFGGAGFGSIPQKNDVVVIKYAITDGASGDDPTLDGKEVTIPGFSAVTGTAQGGSAGGSNDKDVVVYKNVASGSLGTYQSAVTKGQYAGLIATYPGLVDAVTQAQREINPMKLEWMNVIRVSGLTADPGNPWQQEQKEAFIEYLQQVTMYAPRFVYVDAIQMPRDVDVEVYVFNSVDTQKAEQATRLAITQLLSPRPGILMTNIYPSDIVTAIKQALPGMVSYVIINKPLGPMMVTAPESPHIVYTLMPAGGTLGQSVYSYCISTGVRMDDGTIEEGPASNWVFPQIVSAVGNYAIRLEWQAVPNAVYYKLWGRLGGSVGFMAQFNANQLSFIDDGSIVPQANNPPNSIAEVPIRWNSLQNLSVGVKYAERQQRIDITEDPIRKIYE